MYIDLTTIYRWMIQQVIELVKGLKRLTTVCTVNVTFIKILKLFNVLCIK